MSATPHTPCVASAVSDSAQCLASARPAGVISRRPTSVVSRARAGCIPRDRSLFPHFKSRRQPEGHEEPRSIAVLHHPESTERIIRLAIEVHRDTGPGPPESSYAAAPCRAVPCRAESWNVPPFPYGAKPVFRQYTRANLYRLDSGPISLRTKPLSRKSKRSGTAADP
jgi:hypothetical protein